MNVLVPQKVQDPQQRPQKTELATSRSCAVCHKLVQSKLHKMTECLQCHSDNFKLSVDQQSRTFELSLLLHRWQFKHIAGLYFRHALSHMLLGAKRCKKHGNWW